MCVVKRFHTFTALSLTENAAFFLSPLSWQLIFMSYILLSVMQSKVIPGGGLSLGNQKGFHAHTSLLFFFPQINCHKSSSLKYFHGSIGIKTVTEYMYFYYIETE